VKHQYGEKEKKWPSVQSATPAVEIGGIAKRVGCSFVSLANIRKVSVSTTNAHSAELSAR
jgi:hypothetical protein